MTLRSQERNASACRHAIAYAASGHGEGCRCPICLAFLARVPHSPDGSCCENCNGPFTAEEIAAEQRHLMEPGNVASRIVECLAAGDALVIEDVRAVLFDARELIELYERERAA